MPLWVCPIHIDTPPELAPAGLRGGTSLMPNEEVMARH